MIEQASPYVHGRYLWMHEIREVSARCRWGRALLALAWLHLVASLVDQAFFTSYAGTPPHWPFPVLWLVEVLATIGTVRGICGSGWFRASPMAAVTVRVWVTYLILAFSVASSNELMGWSVDWFKTAWCTLGSFGFATMAWLFSPWFLVPAVQMWATGLVIIHVPKWGYLIHGLSWWLALTVIGAILERRRRTAADAGPVGPIRVPVVVRIPMRGVR